MPDSSPDSTSYGATHSPIQPEDIEVSPDEETDLTAGMDENDEDHFYDSPTVEYVPPANLPTSAALSCVLGFLSPGTGNCLRGRYLKGVIQNILLALSFVVLPALGTFLGLFPVWVFVVLLVILFGIWCSGIAHVVCNPPSYVPASLPWKHVGIAFLTFWLPFAFCFFISTNKIIQRTWMGNDTMNPGIHKGDIILVDKTAYWHRKPDYGELVLVEELVRNSEIGRRRAFFGRIIACPGDKVQLFGVHPSVNGKQLAQYVERGKDDVFDSSAVYYELPYSVKEPADMKEPRQWYPIRGSRQLLFSQTNLITLENDYYYVLEDNRDMSADRVHQRYGSVIHKSEIQGRPQYVIYNTIDESHFDRYGLALR